ncbi:hypothetical protein [Oleiagrimonas soli]|uniref:Phosphoglycerate mutase n=1 Tax=Oleiagrimonas soli TaxID=1543381 RepID=A0A099CZ44_9GAMM|nr:hypothetical protein [Oleiagrimonas soli]KGI78305.1 hypothetical protein LF63_0108305 [Oleiagrimonas soli]MBB6183204.1 hypothetical protein [Oleiagrimonas soli]
MLHVLLPNFALCGQDRVLRTWLVRGDRLPDAEHGYTTALGAHFRWPSGGLPAAALLREAVCGDAGGETWLCADPAFVQPDMTGARMLACGTLDLTAADAEALARPLRPLFGDRGFLLETTAPSRWHLRLPRDAQPPAFAAPDRVLGDDLLPYLPQDARHASWRELFNEAQILLHQHPLNAERRARGQMPVNCLWLWGGGRLPSWVKADIERIYTADPLARVLAERARVGIAAVRDFDPDGEGDVLLDLESDLRPEVHWPLLTRALKGHKAMRLDFASGERMEVRHAHRWRFWRKVV